MFEREHSRLCGRSFHARHPLPGPSHRLLQPPLESVMSPTQPPTITIHRPAISHFYDVNYINDAMDMYNFQLYTTANYINTTVNKSHLSRAM